MSHFTLHTLETAPESTKPALEEGKKSFGFIPNLHATMVEAPGLYEGYRVLHKLFSESSFNAEELTVVWQTINVEHGCTYCVPAHTGIAHSMKVDPALTEALRNRESMPNVKLQALQDTTLLIVRNRGKLTEAEMQAFFAAGYGQRQLLEVVLGVAQKVMSNYTNHLAETPVDAAFEKFSWKSEQKG